MAELDPNNPSVPESPVPKINPDYLKAQQDLALHMGRQATVAEQMLQAHAGDPTTEGGIYLRLLIATLSGRLVASSDAAQVWATDLTRDYLSKYKLDGTPVTSSNPPTQSQ